MNGISTVLALMAVMACGWVCKRTGQLSDAAEVSLTKLLFNLFMPAGVFAAGLQFRTELLEGWRFPLMLYGSFVAVMVLAWLLARLRHQPPQQQAVSVLMSIRSNVIFIALPIVSMAYGEEGLKVFALYIAVGMPFYNFVPLMASQLVLSDRFDKASAIDALKRTITNPILLAGAAGILIALLGWTPLLPQWLTQAIDVLATGANGLALIVIGASLQLKRLAADARLCWPDLIIKLIVMPALLLALFWLFPLSNRMLMITSVVTSAVSPAFNCYILACGMKMDSAYASSMLACSTALGLATTAFWVTMTPVLLP